LAAKRVTKDTPVAYFHEQPGEEWPGEIKWEGPGFYEVLAEDKNDHTQANFGKKLEFRLNKQNTPGETPDPENNEGHFVYADSITEDEGGEEE
jgi:hypothetical protein